MGGVDSIVNENALTSLLFNGTLHPAAPDVRSRFLRDIAGIESCDADLVSTQARWQNAGQRAGIIVGIAPLPGLSYRDTNYTQAASSTPPCWATRLPCSSSSRSPARSSTPR